MNKSLVAQTTDTYSHTDQELPCRRPHAAQVALTAVKKVIGPKVGSLGPTMKDHAISGSARKEGIKMVRPERFELPTFWFVAKGG